MTDKIKKLKEKAHNERIEELEKEIDRFTENVVEKRLCPTCSEPCAHGWCGRCERVHPDLG